MNQRYPTIALSKALRSLRLIATAGLLIITFANNTVFVVTGSAVSFIVVAGISFVYVAAATVTSLAADRSRRTDRRFLPLVELALDVGFAAAVVTTLGLDGNTVTMDAPVFCVVEAAVRYRLSTAPAIARRPPLCPSRMSPRRSCHSPTTTPTGHERFRHGQGGNRRCLHH